MHWVFLIFIQFGDTGGEKDLFDINGLGQKTRAAGTYGDQSPYIKFLRWALVMKQSLIFLLF